ncbi:MAG: hypothetical protein LBT79_00735 [Elusimicrobiota bacterium]|jgi:hypothetical protein|nr:hypothetical protein [Elusimicrobiota bacterium]
MANRDYGNEFPSVTEVLGVLRKIGLENWFKYNTAKFCDGESQKGKEVGSQIHEIIQNYIEGKETQLTTEYDEEIRNAVGSFMKFKKDNPAITLKKAEIKMTSQLGFNGTLDAFAYIGAIPVVLDWKTGKAKKEDKPPIYEEYLTQVSAYVKACNETQGTDITDAIIIAFAKDKIAYNKIFLGKEIVNVCFNNIFLPALKIWNAQKEVKKYLKEAKNGNV